MALSLEDSMDQWEKEAKRLGLSVHVLREQVRLSNEVISELIAEENNPGRNLPNVRR